jgi:hypothetical protein
MDIIFLLSVIAFAGWVSVTMLIRQFKMARYHYNIRSPGMLWHMFLLFMSPLVFLGLIFAGIFIIYTYGVLTTGQL